MNLRSALLVGLGFSGIFGARSIEMHAWQAPGSLEAEMLKRGASQAAMDREMANARLDKAVGDDVKVQAALRERAEAKRRDVVRLSKALQGLQAAAHNLSEALASKAKLKTPGGEIKKHVEILLEFVKVVSKERTRVDFTEFKNITNSELGWEALTTAERICPGLAVAIASEGRKVWDIQLLAALPAIEKDLVRLQWMSRQLK